MLPGLFALATVQARAHVSVVDFGAKPNFRADATAAVARAIQAAGGKHAIVVFPPGDYHFDRSRGFERNLYLSNSDVVNPRRISILIENRQNLQLQGKGARLIFHDRVMPFAILNSKRITLSGFTIDWQRPLMSQATVVESDRQGVTLSIDSKRYPFAIEDERLVFKGESWSRRPWGLMEFDPKTRGVAYRTGDDGVTDGDWRNAKATELESGKVRLDFGSRRGPTVGHVLVFRHGSRDHAGTFIEGASDVVLEDVAYRHTSGLGVLAQYSQNLTYRNVEVAPDPTSDRLFAGHDDGFHFSNCKGRILVEGCRFDGLMDDPINVHGTAVQVVRKLGDTELVCRFMHDQSVGLRFAEQRDKVSFIDHETMLSLGVGAVNAIAPKSAAEFVIRFARPVPKDLKIGDALENLTWTPSVTVRKSTFGPVRARGLLVTTPGKVLIEDNVFRSSGAAILIAGDANGWFESGAVTDVTIRDNVFEDCNTSAYQFGDAVISIHPEVPRTGSTPYHRNIRIEGNVFRAFDAPILWAKSVRGLDFRRNTIEGSQTYRPWRATRDGLTFVDCDHVRVEGNVLRADFIGRLFRIESGDASTIWVKGWQ